VVVGIGNTLLFHSKVQTRKLLAIDYDARALGELKVFEEGSRGFTRFGQPARSECAFTSVAREFFNRLLETFAPAADIR
jgi:hypothetical protein